MMMDEEEEEIKNYFPIPNPLSSFSTKIIIFQADILHNCFALLFSPFSFLFSLLSESVHRADETKEKVEAAAARVPSTVVHATNVLVKRVVLGFVGAVYVCVVLVFLLAVAVILGVWVVGNWVDEPVYMKGKLYFDYSEVHPTAVFTFGGGGDDGFGGYNCKKQHPSGAGVPVGHTLYVSLVFLMPESDYNREMGVFQVTSELISTGGNIMAKSSHPCMLNFRSWPIRMMRTCLMGLPLLLGISGETQRIKLASLRHREGFPRTGAIRISLVPRAGTNFLPQLYEAEIVLKSKLPWMKELVRRWKWTFYVWASFYSYAILLLILLCWFKPLILPTMKARSLNGGNGRKMVGEARAEEKSRDERGLSKTMRRWQENRRSKKRAMLESSAATSMSLRREETGANWADDDDDDTSESVCCNEDDQRFQDSSNL